MQLNPILHTEIAAVVNQDCQTFLSRRAAHMTPAQRNHFKDDIANDIKAFFEHYGIPYTKDNLMVAMVAHLWSVNGTAGMFAEGNNPVQPQNDNPYGHAVHGGLAAIDALNHAIENF